MFGFSLATGDSPLTLQPVQCEVRLGYFSRFGITLPFIVAVISLLVNIAHLTLARMRGISPAQVDGEAANFVPAFCHLRLHPATSRRSSWWSLKRR